MTINPLKLSDCITLAKGKPPKEIPYFGLGAEPYLNPDYLRGNNQVEYARGAINSVRVFDGETVLLWDGSNAGEVFRGRKGLLASTMSHVKHGEEFDSNYFYYAIKHFEPYLKGQTSGSGIPHVDKEIFGKLELLVFSTDEQQQIAKILSTLDQAIEQTEAIIAKQQRIKTGLMQDLLTKGIDENGNIRSESTHEFKDSPLGRIPVEWSVEPIEIKLDKLIDYRGRTPNKVGDGVPLITAKNVRSGYLAEEPHEYIAEEAYEKWMTRGIPEVGDVLFTTEAPMGNVAYVPYYKIALAQRLLTLCPKKEELSNEYLFWVLHWQRTTERLNIITSGSTVTGIKQSVFRKVIFMFPEKNE